MAEMSEGQKNFLEWLKDASPEEVREYLPFLRGNAEASTAYAKENTDFAEVAKCDMELKTAALEKLTTRAATDSGQSVTDQSLLTKLLLKNNDTGVVSLGNKNGVEKQARAQIADNKLSLIEYNILRSILSYQLDSETERGGEINISASQLYNKMRKGKGGGKVHLEQQQEIHEYMLGLERRIKVWLDSPASEWLGIEEKRLKNARILHFDYDEGYINGNRTEFYYTIYNVGLLQEIARRAGQLERIPQELLYIKTYKDNKWKNWTLSKKRIELRTVLEIFIFQLLRTNTPISNKKPYADIFADISSIKTRADIKRAKDDIATILNYWQHLGIFESWNEYGNGRGIEIKLCKEINE